MKPRLNAAEIQRRSVGFVINNYHDIHYFKKVKLMNIFFDLLFR